MEITKVSIDLYSSNNNTKDKQKKTTMEKLTAQSRMFILEKIQELETEKKKCENSILRISFSSIQQMLNIEIELLDAQINLLKSK